MNRELNFAKNTIVLLAGKFFPKLVSFITLPIITTCLSKAEYGTYDLLLTITALAIPIATLMIHSAAFRFLIDCRNNKAESAFVITNIFAVVIPMSIAAAIVLFYCLPGLSFAERIMAALYFVFNTLAETAGQITRGSGNNKAYSISSFLLAMINAVGVIFTVFFMDKGIGGILLSLTCANIAAFLYLFHVSRIWEYISIHKVSWDRIKRLLSYSVPLIPNDLSAWVLALSDRLVITFFLGIETNAVYSVANKIPNLLSIAQAVMVMAWQENASVSVEDRDAEKYYANMLDKMFCLLSGFTALLIAATPLLFQLLIRGDYAKAYCQMPILILAMLFSAMSCFFGGIYIAHKKAANVGISTMIAAAINLGIDLCLVNVIGIWAASLSTLTAYMMLYFYRMINCQRFQSVHVNVKKQFAILLLLIIMLILCFMQVLVLNFINLVLGIALFLLLNKKTVRSAWSIVKMRMRK